MIFSIKILVQHLLFHFFLEFAIETVEVTKPANDWHSSFSDSTSLQAITPAQKEFVRAQNAWADSVLATLTTEQKVGQLFMISTYSNRTESTYRLIEEQIRKYHLGGIIFFQGNARQQVRLTNRYQAASKIPLLIGMDAEWGLGMRLDSTFSFPKSITLGAIQNPRIIEEIGAIIGQHCRRIGVHINFSPVADINTNPENPVINFRSFGEDKERVAALAVAYNRGLRRMKVMGSAKHFPGHGDADSDSHLALPLIRHSENRLRTNEFYPFQRLIHDSVASVMVGHLFVPSLDAAMNTPATVSKRIVHDILQKELGFDRLIITDALNMRGLTKFYPTGQAEVAALKAGNDLLLQTAQLPVAYAAVLDAVKSQEVKEEELNKKVHKILRAKYWAGAHRFAPLSEKDLQTDLNSLLAEQIKEKAFNQAVTVVQNEGNVLPFSRIDTTRFASVAIGRELGGDFQETLSRYAEVKHFSIPFKPSKESEWQWVLEEASKFEIVFVSVHDMNNLSARNFGVTYSTVQFIEELQKRTKVVVCAFGNPYGLKLFARSSQLVCGYEDDPGAHRAVAQVIFGGQNAAGKLPVTAHKTQKLGQGMVWSASRLGMESPLFVRMDAQKLAKIDTIALEGIQKGAYPGCQVLVARRGKVVYEKSFGTYRYGDPSKITRESLYDLASITKVAATLQAVMLLYEQGRIDLRQPIKSYLPELAGTNKDKMTVQDVLWHQAGLVAFVPFWRETKVGNTFQDEYYLAANEGNSLAVTEQLFIKPTIGADVWKWIIESKLHQRQDARGEYAYLYSDLGLIMLQKLVERITKQPLDVFVTNAIYRPLGMTATLFNPTNVFPKEQIAPTANDYVFRGAAIHGTVHDPNAALLGGVAGHAGLFSHAWDLAKLIQMHLQSGVYGPERIFKKETVQYFAQTVSPKSGRGLGWNKPNPAENSATFSPLASPLTFGHTGFTGTVVWADPKEDLLFIFLSNRVYPNEENNKINLLRIRQRMHTAAYQAIIR
jgi:beta-glucosidase-like glycosyl hydrolase/CubicO group peptidase (beta-lactamase class C family)